MNRRELDPQSSPVARFGAHLRSSREARGWIQDDLAARMGYSGTHISAVETTRKSPTLRFAKRADAVFGGNQFEDMWRSLRSTSLLEGFPEYLCEEEAAKEVRMFELGVVPGPLQTSAYATALAVSDVQRGLITSEQAKERVSFLETRQRRLLEGPEAPLVYAVMDESCLRRVVGGPEVMLGQFDHLEKLAAHPKVLIQTVPFSMGELRPLLLPVVLLTMGDRSLVGYTESASRGYLERDEDLIRAWERAYDQLQAGALHPAASLDLIRAIRKELQP